MKKRALIFDVYGTLLEVGPAPKNADAAWTRLWSDALKSAPQLSRLDFSVLCDSLIRKRHEAARKRGIAHPEINWPSVVIEAVPGLAGCPGDIVNAFASGFMALSRSIVLRPETAGFLRWAISEGALLGIASNAQAYTIEELAASLKALGLDMGIFQPDLCFWSYRYGFSKPDPHVFQIVDSRLEVLGVPPSETWMVGDRADNDTEPALRHGWRAWLFGHEPERGWKPLREHLTRS